MFFLLFMLAAYLLGCINGAYYVGKVIADQDVRLVGSFNAGARNAGRVFGRKAFFYTVLIDAAKTVIPLVAVTLTVGEHPLIQGLIAGSVMLGHIWPLQLQFQGGKGVVVYLAAALVLAPLWLLTAGVIVLLLYTLKASFTVAGLIGISTIPLLLYISADYILAIVFSILLIIVILLHRNGDGT